ncbi:MAG: DMT family transporter [Desulfovibrio sp.]
MGFLFIGAIIISFSAIFVKFAATEPDVTAFYRVFFACLGLGVIQFIRRKPFLSGKDSWFYMTICSAAFVVDLACWHRSIIYVGPGLATLLGNFQAIFLTALTIVWFKEKLSFRFVAAIILAISGTAMITGLDWSGYSPDYAKGIMYGLVTAVFYTIYILALKKTLMLEKEKNNGADSTAAMTAMCLLTSLMFLGKIGASDLPLAIPDTYTLLSLLSLGLVCQLGGWVLISRGLTQVKPAVAGLILLLQPTLSFTWDVLLFHRPFGIMEAVGGALALTGVYLGSQSGSADSGK